MNNALEFCQIEQDYNLYNAYERYIDLIKAFEKQYKRVPKCDIYIGSIGIKTSFRSCITARWDDMNGQHDARVLLDLYNSFYE